MKHTGKKLLSLALALVLLLGLSVSAFAVDTTGTGNVTGTGTYTGAADGNVWNIEFPTSEANPDFIVDPTGMVAKATESYEGINLDNATGSVLFQNRGDDGTAEEVTKITGTSDPIKVTNKGSTDVFVELYASMTATTMKLVGTAPADTTTSTDPELYIAVSQNGAAAAAVTAIGALFEYEVKADTTAFNTEFIAATDSVPAHFGYVLKEAAEEDNYAGWKSVSYTVTGKANPKAEAWTGTGITAPNLKLTWNVRSKSVDAIEVEITSSNDGTACATVKKVVPKTDGTVTFDVFILPGSNKIIDTSNAPTAKASLITDANKTITDSQDLTIEATTAKDVNGAKAYTVTVPIIGTANTNISKVKSGGNNPNKIVIAVTYATPT